MKRFRIDIDDVLKELDSVELKSGLLFTCFASSSSEFIGARLSVFSDGVRWAIVIGSAWFGVSRPSATPVLLSVDTYGNSVLPIPKSLDPKKSSGSFDHNYYLPIENAKEAFVQFPAYLIRPDAENFEIRGEPVPLKFPRAIEREAGLLDPPEPFMLGTFPQLKRGARWSHKVFRAIYLQRPELILPTDEEMRSRLPGDLPCILNLSEWRHPELGESPSDTECFQQLAEVCASCDPAKYFPTEPANTHWRHWEDV